MEIFPERLLSDLDRLPGGNHTFLKQVCAPDGAPVRERLQLLTERLGPPMEDRAADLLGSFDNRRFFQGFAEVATLGLLQRGRWNLAALHPPGPRLELRGPGGESVFVAVLAFLHQTRPGGEQESRKRLSDELGRVRSRERFVVHIRRWLPHDFEPAPIRRAVELWLQRVARGEWDGRYAAYEDEHLALEFCLTRQRTKGRQSPVAEILGPFVAHRELEAIEPRIVQELDRHLAGAHRSRPLLIACVADQPWQVTGGYVRDFLYGRASRMSVEEGIGTEVEYNDQASVSLFRDPLYSCVSGVMFVDRAAERPAEVRAEAWLNPWAQMPIRPSALPVRSFGLDDARTQIARENARRRAWVLRWHAEHARSWEIG